MQTLPSSLSSSPWENGLCYARWSFFCVPKPLTQTQQTEDDVEPGLQAQKQTSDLRQLRCMGRTLSDYN